jgi:hypothetical protein
MDKFEPQSVGHVKEGHEESDISIRGIVWFGVFLAAGGVSAFVLMIGMIWGMEKWERSREPKLTPMEQQMLDERAATNQGVGQTLGEHDVKPAPDWFGRGKMEDRLSRTFKDTSPRLQYDDEHDMRGFVGSEEKWLDSTGKSSDGSIHIPVSRAMEILAQRGLPQTSGSFQPANVGAPSAAYPSGAASTGQPATSTPAGGAKK